MTADDGDPANNTGSDSITVTVSNVAPVVNTVTMLNIDPVTGTATLSATFTDPGADTFPGRDFTVTYSGGSATVTPAVVSGRTMTAQVQLPRGCYTYTVTVTVRDDGGVGSKTGTYGSTDIYQAGFRDPIRDNERNIAKYGNVVPVKVQLSSSCSGAVITTPVLHLTVANEDVSDDVPDGSPNVVVESVSNADTGTHTRIVGGMYIYNLSTRSMKAGQD